MAEHKERHATTLKGVFNGLPVVDAEADIRVYIHEEDIRTAAKKDFANCVIANTCQRAFDSSTVAILKNVAYVEVPDEDGNRRVERFLIGEKARKMIIDFDTGKDILPGACFVLNAPRPSQTLDGNKARNARLRQRDHKKEYEKKKKKKEVRIKGDISKYDGNKSDLRLMDVRNGTGAVQMRRRHESVEPHSQ